MAEDTQTDTEQTAVHVSALDGLLTREVVTAKEAFQHVLTIVASLHRRVIALESGASNGDNTE